MNSKLAWLASLAAALGLGFLLGQRAAHEPAAIAPEEMATSLRAALHDKDPLRRALEFERLVRGMDRANLPSAIGVYREVASQAEMEGAALFLGRWAELDRDGLAAEMKGWPEERSRAQGYGWAIYQIAVQDGFERALALYEETPKPLRLAVGFRLVEGCVNAGRLDEITRWAATQDQPEDRQRALRQIIQALARESADAVIRWADSIPAELPNQVARMAFGLVLQKLVRLEPARAVAFRAERLDRSVAEKSMVPLATAWTDSDPVAAVAWVVAQPEGEERDAALRAVVDRWGAHDQPAAVRWLDAQEPRAALDPLYQRFARGTTISDPAGAIRLASRIGDPQQRESVLTEVSRYWFRRRPDALRGWLASVGVSEGDANAIIEGLEKKRAKQLEQATDSGNS